MILIDPSMTLKDKIVQEFRQSHLKLQAFRSLQESCKLLVTLRAYCIIISPISVQSRIRKYADLFLSKTRVKMVLDDDEINQLITFISAREAQDSSTDRCFVSDEYRHSLLDNDKSRARTYTQEWSLAGIDDGDIITQNTEGVQGYLGAIDVCSSWVLGAGSDCADNRHSVGADARVHIGAKVSRRPQLSPTEITRLTPIHLNVVVPRVWPRYTKLAALQIVQYYRDCQISVEPAPLTYAEVCWLEALTKETIGGWYDDSCGGA